MSNVDKIWLRMLILGIIFLVGYMGITFYESSTGMRVAFTEEIKPFPRGGLVSSPVLEHLRTDSYFNLFTLQRPATSDTTSRPSTQIETE